MPKSKLKQTTKPLPRSRTDYVKISRKLFAGQTIEEIFARSLARQRARKV